MLELHDNITELASASGYKWKDVCFKYDSCIWWIIITSFNFCLWFNVIRIPVVTEPETNRRRKRQANSGEIESFGFDDFDFGGFDSNFEDISPPALDPNFEPAIDLPTGKFFFYELNYRSCSKWLKKNYFFFRFVLKQKYSVTSWRDWKKLV